MAIRRTLVVSLPAIFLVVIACGGGGKQPPTPTPTATVPALSGPLDPRAVEADDDPSLPGEYVNLPEIYDGYYGDRTGTNTGAHRHGPIDYSAQGLPPAGGPHWGSGPCPADPAQARADCGPVPWGIYRKPWPAESLVHNMEHAGVVIWYNTSDQDIIDDLERFATQQLRQRRVVLAPYPDMEADNIAITVWSRRDEFPIGEYNPERLQRFIDALYCRFDPEGFCPSEGLTFTAAARYHPKAL